jgi:hypothetical protein
VTNSFLVSFSTSSFLCTFDNLGRIFIPEFEGLRNIGKEIAVTGCKNKEQWQQIVIHVIKYKEKLERVVRMY